MEMASEIIGQEVAVLAHEIRQPLASILFAVECSKETAHERFACQQMCQVVERQVRYLTQIIDDVLDIGQVQHGKLRLHKQLIDVGRVIDTALETIRPLLRKREIRLTISLSHERIYLMADRLRVQQIANNLLHNACKYTEPGGSISVGVKVEGDSVSIEVRDTGIGIPPDMLPRVFDLFHQGGEKRHGRFSGLGIGLALVKLVVELHGGTITAHSRGTGTGSTFVIRLPGGTKVCREDPKFLEPPPETTFDLRRSPGKTAEQAQPNFIHHQSLHYHE